MEENNQLIAEFMGMTETNLGWVDGNRHILNDDRITALFFNTSWDWLMPVVRQIIEICCNDDVDSFLSDEYTSILETIPLAIIEDSHKVVVEFINFYNENK